MTDHTPLVETSPQQEPLSRRIPNLGHALLFLALAGFFLILYQGLLLWAGPSPVTIHNGTITVAHPALQLATMTATYVSTLAAAWFFFGAVWPVGFIEGLRWSWLTARRQATRLIALGALLGAMVQTITYFIPTPKTLPIDDFFLRPSTAWLITLFGTVMAPIFEEIAFRGFLVPAFAIAYDWLSLPRTPAAIAHWQTGTSLSPAGLTFSAILSSLLFALLHAQQVDHAVPALLVLFSVSLVLTFVRIKTQSVAASVLVHGTYNLSVFLTVMFATGGYRHLERLGK